MHEHGGEQQPRPRYIEQAEDLLGVTLLPEHVPYPTRDGSVREIAYRAALRMMATERHKDRQHATVTTGYSAQAWNNAWQLEAQAKRTILSEHSNTIDLLHDEVAIANDVIAYHLDPETHVSSAAATPRDLFQELTKLHMWNYVEYPGKPKNPSEQPTMFDRLRGAGLAVVAPVASGKTRLQGWCLKAMKIGEPVAEGSDRKRRALVVLSSQAMIDQYLDDGPDGDFRNVLGPDVSMGAVWQFSKANNEDITLVIDQTLPKLIEEGVINPEDYHAAIVDEGHLSLRGQILDSVSKLGARLLLFTATPARNEVRDLRDRFAHVEEGSLRSFVEQGILNEVRLMTFQYASENQVRLAGHLAIKALHSGRRIVVYCPARNPNDEAGQTQAIRDYINEHADLPPELFFESQPAHVLGSVNSKARNETLLEHFKRGYVQALLTVNMLTEGYNDPGLGAVLLIDETSSSDANQRGGRCMRTMKDKPESWVMEMIPTEIERNRDFYSLWAAYGFEHIVQAHKVSRTKEDARAMQDAAEQTTGFIQGWLPGDHVRTTESFYDYEPRSATAPPPRTHIPQVTKADFEREQLMGGLQASAYGGFAEDEPVRSVVISQDGMRRERFLANAESIVDLVVEFDLPQQWSQYYLSHNNMPYESVFDDSEGIFIRHYHPEARRALEQASKRSRTAARFKEQTVLNMYGMRRQCAQELCPEDRLYFRSQSIYKYSISDLAHMEAGFAAYPVADDDEVLLSAVRSKFRALGRRESFIDEALEGNNEIVIVDKRRETSEGLTPPQPHITKAEHAYLEEMYTTLPRATTKYMSVKEIADTAEVDRKTVISRVTDEEYAERKLMMCRIRTDEYDNHFPAAMGQQIVERLKRRGLPLHLVPISVTAQRVDASRAVVARFLQDYKDQLAILNLGIGKGASTCLPWELLKKVEESFPLLPDAEHIDFELIASNTVQGQQYARRIQEQYMGSKKLAAVDLWLPMAEAFSTIKCTPVAGMLLFRRVVAKQDGILETNRGRQVHIDIVVAAQKIDVTPPPSNWVPDGQIRRRLRQSGRAPDDSLVIPAASQRLGRAPDTGTIDLYYSPDIARRIMGGAKRRAP